MTCRNQKLLHVGKGKWKRRQSSQIPTAVGETPSPISRGRSSTTEAIAVGTWFGKDGQEVESPTNGSGFDEDEMQFESDGSEGPPQSLRPVSQPSFECVNAPKGDENDKLQTEEDETRFDELNDDQTAPESPKPAPNRLR